MKADNQIVLSEVNEILHQLDDEALSKLPKKLLNTFEKSDHLDVSYIKPNIPLEDIDLQNETREILALISYKYFCNEQEKKIWNKKIRDNEIKYQEKIKENYNINKLLEEIKKIKEANNE